MTEHETFYGLLRAVRETKAEWEKWQARLAAANRRGRNWSTADWHIFYRVKAEHEAALAAMAAFVARAEAVPAPDRAA